MDGTLKFRLTVPAERCKSLSYNSYMKRGKFMLDVKEAVKIAIDFTKDILSSERINQITLEEVELDEGESFWYVTLGIGQLVRESPFAVFDLKGTKLVIKYKTLKIDRGTGKVISMKIRKE
jgi:hypothetical protein